MKASEKICKLTVLTVSVITTVFSGAYLTEKIHSLFTKEGMQLLNPVFAANNEFLTESEYTLNNDTSSVTPKAVPAAANITDADTDYAVKDHDAADTDHTFETTYLVTESLFRESNLSCNNFYVKNSTDLSPDIQGYLNKALPFKYEDTTDPQVLIVHTHATESFMEEDVGYYYESFYPRDTNDNYNIVRVGKEITDTLTKNGIGTVHCCKHHDDPQYYGAYDNSADSIMYYLEKYPTIKIILDIHRDSITTEENEKIKPTFMYNGKKAAQIMIMCGNDNYGYYDFPNWEDNLSLAVKLQSAAETRYPGMTRPLYFGNFMYNMNLAPGSLLIEVGTDANTLDEAVLTGELLGNVIAEVLFES